MRKTIYFYPENAIQTIGYQVPENKRFTIIGYRAGFGGATINTADTVGRTGLCIDAMLSEVIEGETVPSGEIELIRQGDISLNCETVILPIPLVLEPTNLIVAYTDNAGAFADVQIYGNEENIVNAPPVVEDEVPGAAVYQIASDETIGGEE